MQWDFEIRMTEMGVEWRYMGDIPAFLLWLPLLTICGWFIDRNSK